MTRAWKDIPDLIGRYQVSNDGFVRSLPDINHLGRFMPGNILRHGVNEKGYAHVSLGGRTYKVHRLVAQAFVSGEGPQVNHKDGDKLNNHWTNLEWCDNSHNQTHRHRVLGQPSALQGKTGINCKNSKPVAARWVSTGNHIGMFGSAAEAARLLGVDSSGISMAARGEIRAYKGMQWVFISRKQYLEATDAAA